MELECIKNQNATNSSMEESKTVVTFLYFITIPQCSIVINFKWLMIFQSNFSDYGDNFELSNLICSINLSLCDPQFNGIMRS